MIMDHVTIGTRVWFITGTSSGVGRAVAVAALEHGDRVVATARDTRDLRDLVSRYPGTVLAVKLDVRDEQAARRAVAEAVERFGRIDVVFNNAAFSLFGSVESTSDQQVRALFDTAVFGVWNVMRATLPVLREQRAGHVLQMSSVFGHMALPGGGALAAAKQAVGGFTESLMHELAPMGVKFTLVEPYILNTRFVENMIRAESAPDYVESVDRLLDTLLAIPADQRTPVEDVARALLDLVQLKEPPLHLALGGKAEDVIREALNGRLRDLEAWTTLARSV
jgi:NAD(P)-dependent dehydrogenase (short-subunit alcohol dehydrogenase family)